MTFQFIFKDTSNISIITGTLHYYYYYYYYYYVVIH
jgi:hypothetical protein